jgi:hypothetical protein
MCYPGATTDDRAEEMGMTATLWKAQAVQDAPWYGPWRDPMIFLQHCLLWLSRGAWVSGSPRIQAMGHHEFEHTPLPLDSSLTGAC